MRMDKMLLSEGRAYTVLAMYIYSPTQAFAFSASCTHASTHSTLRILCNLYTCIHPLNPAHSLQAVHMHPPTQPCAYSARCVYSDPACKPSCKSACGLCMQSLHVGKIVGIYVYLCPHEFFNLKGTNCCPE